MGATYTRQSSSSIVDGGVIEASDINAEFNQILAAFAVTSGHTHDGTTAEGGPITKLLGTAITIGDATTGTDIAVTFDGESNDGIVTWMEDEDYFQFSDDLLLTTTEKLQFRDTAIYINSSADGQLDLVADTEIQIAATTVDINGAVDVSGTLTLGTISNNSTDITLDSSGDIILDAGGANVTIKDDGTSILDIANNSTDVEFTVSTADKNFKIKGTDGASAVTALDIDMALAGKATFNGDVVVGGDLTVTGDDITMGTNTAGNILVADGTNFNSIAATSLSEISTIANDDVFIAVDTSGGGLKKVARSAIVAGLATSAAISNIVEDTSPQLGGNLDTNSQNILIDDAHFIGDENGNEQIIFQTTSSAVNQFDITNAATGSGPKLEATGGDSNIDLEIEAKGTGHVTIRGNTNPGTIQFNCESNSHGQQIKPQPHSVGSSAVHTLPDITGDLIAGKIGGTNFTNSLLIGHATTGTLNNANSNTGVGIAALDALTSGDANTAVGLRALGGVTSAVDNTGMGSDSGKNLSVGSNNSSFGKQSLYNSLSGNNNVAMGDFALEDSTASNNTALGSQAGKEISTSSYNIVIGRQAGDNITTGSGNVIIGTVDAAAADSARTLKIAGFDGSTTTTWISGDSNGVVTFADDIIIKDAGTIGSASDVDAIAIGSDGDVTLTQDLELQHDGAILSFGANDEVTLTHVHNDGLLLNTDMQLQFRDSAINIRSDADGDLDINADDEVEINSTLIDVNGNLDVSGTLAQAGVATFALAANVAQVALSSSSNAIAWDASAAANAYHVTTENTTFSAPSNAVEGAFIAVEINYNGSHTIAFNTVFEFAASTAPTTTDTDGKTDILVFRYNGAVWQEVGRTLNLSES